MKPDEPDQDTATRSHESADTKQIEIARRALEMKEALPEADYPSPGRTANTGIESIPRPDYPPSGAFDAEGQRPVLERSRKKR